MVSDCTFCRIVAGTARPPMWCGGGRMRSRYVSDFHLITNCGPWADQTQFHLHWHVVPRRENDGLVMPWTAQQKRRTETHHA